jgi:hypothetical protein
MLTLILLLLRLLRRRLLLLHHRRLRRLFRLLHHRLLLPHRLLLRLFQATPPPTVLLAHEHRQRRYASDGSFDGCWDEDDEDLSGLIAAAHDERGLQLEQLAWELPTAAARMGGEREISIIQLRRPV